MATIFRDEDTEKAAKTPKKVVQMYDTTQSSPTVMRNPL